MKNGFHESNSLWSLGRQKPSPSFGSSPDIMPVERKSLFDVKKMWFHGVSEFFLSVCFFILTS